MSFALAPFAWIPLDDSLLELLIAEHEAVTLPRLERLWRYYRNALAEPDDEGGSSSPPAQRSGLPARLKTEIHQLRRDDRFGREIVIENDIAWRIHTLVDFMFPASPRIHSCAPDESRRRDIEAIFNAVIDANGGAALWQNAALLGSVYGFVDFMLACDELSAAGLWVDRHEGAPAGQILSSPGVAPSKPITNGAMLDRIASCMSIETVEAPRAIPLLNPRDYRAIDAYILFYRQPLHEAAPEGWLSKLARRVLGTASHGDGSAPGDRRASMTVIEIHTATHVQRYEDGALVSERINRLGRLPVVHVQNLAQPLRYEGLSDVEPLIPLQDELNTRISDRANRVTMQSFRMWLGKGIERFTERPIGPGQMWVTDNPDASIESFGGDADSPSERQHIEELREALDKASGVTPAAAGHIKARVGNLTSENALRISLMGTIAKIKRKRVTYGAAIQHLCELILHALDVHGVYRTHAGERQVEVSWTDPLPVDESRRISDALSKAQLGVPLAALRAELGYASEDAKHSAGAAAERVHSSP